MTCSHSRTIHASDNDVVAVVRDCYHRTDTAQTENRSHTGVELAHKGSKEPDSSNKRVKDKHRELGEHHAKVRECQVDDKHICRGPQLFGFQEQVQHQGVPCN